MIEIEIPLPPRACSPNQSSSRHWRYRHNGTKEYREWAFMAGMGANKPQLQPPVLISSEWYMGKRGPDDCYRPLDTANAIASLKAAIDGLVDARIIPGDNHKQVKWGECRLYRTAKEHRGRCCVMLRLEELK